MYAKNKEHNDKHKHLSELDLTKIPAFTTSTRLPGPYDSHHNQVQLYISLVSLIILYFIAIFYISHFIS